MARRACVSGSAPVSEARERETRIHGLSLVLKKLKGVYTKTEHVFLVHPTVRISNSRRTGPVLKAPSTVSIYCLSSYHISLTKRASSAQHLNVTIQVHHRKKKKENKVRMDKHTSIAGMWIKKDKKERKKKGMLIRLC